MLADEDQSIRRQAVDLILNVRESRQINNKRKFLKPTINFDASTYCELSNIRGIDPPLTQSISNEELILCHGNSKNFVSENVRDIPCHTQAVERCIQLVSRVSSTVTGEDSRNKLICTTIASRAALPKANSKKDYFF